MKPESTEEALYVKMLRFLYERQLEQLGIKAEIIITKNIDFQKENIS